jgi:hypothetical protein
VLAMRSAGCRVGSGRLGPAHSQGHQVVSSSSVELGVPVSTRAISPLRQRMTEDMRAMVSTFAVVVRRITMVSKTETSVPTPCRSTARTLYFRARLNHWLWRKEAAAAFCHRVLTLGDDGRAYRLLAELKLPGPDYLAVLGSIHRFLRPITYFEIGVARGESLRLARSETYTVGIDPCPRLKYALRTRQRVFRETSDEFFAKHDVIAAFGGRPIQMAFIDGMHQFEFALRDFANIEKSSAPEAVIFVHDCYPLDEKTAARQQTTTFWSGDVWRLVVVLKKHRPDLCLHTIGTPPTGLAVISGLNPRSRLIQDNLSELITEGLAIDFSAVADCKAEALNLVPNDWGHIRRILDSTRASH